MTWRDLGRIPASASGPEMKRALGATTNWLKSIRKMVMNFIIDYLGLGYDAQQQRHGKAILKLTPDKANCPEKS